MIEDTIRDLPVSSYRYKYSTVLVVEGRTSREQQDMHVCMHQKRVKTRRRLVYVPSVLGPTHFSRVVGSRYQVLYPYRAVFIHLQTNNDDDKMQCEKTPTREKTPTPRPSHFILKEARFLIT